jgi:hypothetical protein
MFTTESKYRVVTVRVWTCRKNRTSRKSIVVAVLKHCVLKVYEGVEV